MVFILSTLFLSEKASFGLRKVVYFVWNLTISDSEMRFGPIVVCLCFLFPTPNHDKAQMQKNPVFWIKVSNEVNH